MDWRTVRFDWNRARAFLVTAEEGSFSAAARALGMAQPTLGRQVDGLEQELGVLLFDRVGKRLVLTEAGMDLLEHVRGMGDAARRMSLAASGQSQAIEGNVTISVGDVTAAYLLPPILEKLRGEHPGIHLEIVATNSASDLRRREADIAIRNFRPQQPELVARKVREMDGTLYAATRYLERIGRPRTKEQLRAADFIGFDRGDAMIKGLRAMGLEVDKRSLVLVSENQIVQWELVKQGLGVGVMSSVIGDAEPGVEPALPSMPKMTFPVWLVSHRELHTSRRVRIVFELLARELAAI